jgi:hypothetical protein
MTDHEPDATTDWEFKNEVEDDDRDAVWVNGDASNDKGVVL